jgi:PAS domain S-box-containing protein
LAQLRIAEDASSNRLLEVRVARRWSVVLPDVHAARLAVPIERVPPRRHRRSAGAARARHAAHLRDEGRHRGIHSASAGHGWCPLTGLAQFKALDGDVEEALDKIAVPSYVIDTVGVIRWINPAAEALVGDVRGKHFTSVVAPEDSRRARELFSQKVLGTVSATEASGVLVSTAGKRVAVEVSAVPLTSGDRAIGVFGQLAEAEKPAAAPHPDLTPRQADVLRLLEHGRSTQQIADELHLTTETVRNHVRNLLRALGVHSRIEAVAAARRAERVAG